MQRRCQGQFDFGLRLTNKNCMDFTRVGEGMEDAEEGRWDWGT